MSHSGTMAERMRLQALERYQILDTAPEARFDDIAKLAAVMCNTPIAMVSLIDEKRQWLKAKVGLEFNEVPREIAFCSITMESRDMFVVPDARRDPRFADNPFVVQEQGILFYAGAPLISHDGYVLGSLGVMDRIPRDLTPQQLQALSTLAHEVVAQLELRKLLSELEDVIAQRDSSQAQLQQANQLLEERVSQRTAELNRANTSLQQEVERRGREAVLSQAIIDSLPGIFYLMDRNGKFERWNRNFERITGYSHDEMARTHALSFFATPQEKSVAQSMVRQALAEGSSTVEAELLTKSGKRIPYYFTAGRIELDNHLWIAGMGIDITERRRSEEILRLKNRAIQASVNAIIITDLEGNIEYANPAFENITGYSVTEAVGCNCRFLQGNDRAQAGVARLRNAIRQREESSVLLRNYRKDGRLFWNDVHIAPVRGPDGEVTHFVGVLNDISDIKHYEAELERQANFDTLTELVNRNVLKDRMRQAIATAQRERTFVTVGFIDLDNFKFINDSLGHNIGDELLKRVADRLVRCLRGQDTIARYGGDEFAFVLVGQKDEKSVAALMERVLKTIDRPFNVDGHKFFISCSIGVSFYPRDGLDPDTLMKNADAAMYRAKEKGRNNFQFYTPAMNKRVTERLSLEAKLRQALEREEFALYYQPKVELASGHIVGVEALLRWHCPSGATIGPATFIPLAEETGLIVPIGEWVLGSACAHIKALQEIGLPPLRVAVNISARQLDSGPLIDVIRGALMKAGLEATFLELELTESLVMTNPEEVIKLLHDLREMGLWLAIDDFGTGYSSLSYLQRLPVDRLKIDQSFVRDIGADPNDAIIARAVISLGHSLGMSVIAEGVSSSEQLSFLRQNGCDEMQGYLFSRPLPFEELTMLLRENRVLPLH
ncbi:sensor domain-containing phosphodiesterase [Noviherbaspirillum autotrophicum]|uniref:sensor domain-containing phosphodiesterase n=1 Tax=Noviherbaspirillum autotrophicum TaxID=709839 RepID=UPI000693EA23|nr:EAL domain-containing protein [Noviherbaspirillum autotrophicum]